ncbi:MAG TPA: hypothetical protein VJ793_12795 [Anaerolineae bacterium]|nr:hypothetical protein [Anaerolineae bacterium]
MPDRLPSQALCSCRPPGNSIAVFAVSDIDEQNAEEGDMELVLVLMLGFLLLCARSNGQKRADVGVVEVVLAATVLMLLLGQAAG